MPTYVLAIDQGTTSSRAILFREDLDGRRLAQKEFAQHFPASGWVEHEPEDLWSTIARGLPATSWPRPGASAGDIAAIGITNQRETTLVWDRATGKAIHRAIVWQDRRTADICAALKAAGQEETVSRADRACSSTPISPAPRSPGSSTMCRAREREPRPASSPSARSTPSSCGG